jgi:hypothetical protein
MNCQSFQGIYKLLFQRILIFSSSIESEFCNKQMRSLLFTELLAAPAPGHHQPAETTHVDPPCCQSAADV